MSVIHLDFRTFCHATEVEERVREAVRFATGCQEMSRTRSEGYHGNEIIILGCHISRKADIRSFFRRLSVEDLHTLLDSIDQRMDDDGQFFFRLDKQRAFQEELVLFSGDDCIHVRAKVESYPKRREKALENAKAMLRGLLDRPE
jgi:hypothetical protein